MKFKEIRFDAEYLYATDEAGRTWKQSLLWYPSLKAASDEERNDYKVGVDGFHWRKLDEDISFESFGYEDAIPSPFQEFFLKHKEINIAEFAKRIGMNATLLRNYVNGFKKPSERRIQAILGEIRKLGEEYISA